jgi:hypothetical protein
MDDEAYDRDEDTGICDVKRLEGMRERHVQIEKRKIDHVSVEKPIGQVAHDPGEKKGQGEIPKSVARLCSPQKQGQDKNERNTREDDEKQIVVLERAEGSAVIGDVNDAEEIRDDDVNVFRPDMAQDQVLRELIKGVKRE